jgi:integrase
MTSEHVRQAQVFGRAGTLLSTGFAGGADLKTVMDRMGHSQIQTTQKYLHALPDAEDRALAAFQRTRERTRAGAVREV